MANAQWVNEDEVLDARWDGIEEGAESAALVLGLSPDDTRQLVQAAFGAVHNREGSTCPADSRKQLHRRVCHAELGLEEETVSLTDEEVAAITTLAEAGQRRYFKGRVGVIPDGQPIDVH